MGHIMTTKEVSQYLNLHKITICKYAAKGKIPAIRIGHVWRFDKNIIDRWIRGDQNETEANEKPHRKDVTNKPAKKSLKK